MPTPTDTALDETVADLFRLDRRVEPVENFSMKDCSGDCTDDGCSNKATNC